MRSMAGFVGAFLASAVPALAQPAATQFVDLAVLSIEVRGDNVRPGAPLQVSARILRRDGGAPPMLDAVVRFQTGGDARPFAERRITLAPDSGAVVSVPWPARAGRHVISVAVGSMTPRAIDRTRGNDVLTTADIVVPTTARQAAAAAPTAIAVPPLGARRAAAVAVGGPALAAASAPRSPVAAATLRAASAPRAAIAADRLSLRSAGAAPVSAAPLAASSAPRQSVAATRLSAASATTAIAVTPPLSAASAPPAPPPTTAAPAAAASDAATPAPSTSPPRQP